MIPQTRKYFIIIVHYRDAAITLRALDLLRAGTKKPDGIVIVDHGVQPLTVPTQAHEWIIRPKENTGYGAGINVGLGALYSKGVRSDDIIVCMNDEVEVGPATLMLLQAWWQAHPAPAVLGVRVHETTGTVTGLGHVNLVTGRAEMYTPAQQRRTRVPYIHGAFFSAPFRVFMAAKGVPEHYFLYWEDVAFSQRVAIAGFALQFADNIAVKHCADSRSSPWSQRTNRTYYQVRNGALFMQQETGPIIRAGWWMNNRFRYIYHLLRDTDGGVVRKALGDALRNKTGRRDLV